MGKNMISIRTCIGIFFMVIILIFLNIILKLFIKDNQASALYPLPFQTSTSIPSQSSPYPPPQIIWNTPTPNSNLPIPNPYPMISSVTSPALLTDISPQVYISPMPIPAGLIKGELEKITMDNGLCTNYPKFISRYFIGTGTNIICTTNNITTKNWTTIAIPQGTKVIAGNVFPPGGGWEFVTDIGICTNTEDQNQWECKSPYQGFPYWKVKVLENIDAMPVFLLGDSIIYENQTFKIQDIIGKDDAQFTALAISDKIIINGELLPAEIWAGTNNYGLIVIHPETGRIKLYNTNDGLPSNSIYSIASVHCPKMCDFREIWVATDKGVGHWDGQNWINYTTADGLPSNNVLGVDSIQRNTAWIITSKSAIFFDGSNWQMFPLDGEFSKVELKEVVTLGTEIWFTTNGDGLLILKIVK